ncbi:membrane dipeptidase [Pontixanthobacter gangjinensis]|uniref:Peptidase M19 n=1 Tax=Pontixanthobacter gangjinensis TaxID=1028742 RepID=A0A6I4SLD5_9SPHN|nr:membrane dipeptidase [Pontixanthobacter gangjinensis]MXO55602.1 peptidase M19 [Pontixanthobacter gangjinensis]
MIRKILLSLIGLLVIGTIAFFILAPGMIERDMNRIDGKPLPEISAEAQALHDTLTIVDLHSDTLLWKRNLLDRAERGQMDLPRLQDGNVALQIFSSVTKTPKDQNYDSNSAESDNITGLVIGQLQPTHTWDSLLQRSLWHGQKLDKAAEGSDRALLKISNAETLAELFEARDAATDTKPVGAMLSIEGLHNLEGNAENLGLLFEAGFRMASLTHFFDNELAGSMHGLKKGGLTPMGREVMARMEQIGMIVDIAHLSKAGVAEVLASATRPVVSSHGGVQATCKVNRNLNDNEIRGLAETGGIIGIGYWEGAVCDTSPAAIAKAMKHVRDLVGIKHVALGSDYDGAVTVRFDTSGLVQVTQALMEAGFSEDEIRDVMGRNAIRVLTAGIMPAPAAALNTPEAVDPAE